MAEPKFDIPMQDPQLTVVKPNQDQPSTPDNVTPFSATTEPQVMSQPQASEPFAKVESPTANILMKRQGIEEVPEAASAYQEAMDKIVASENELKSRIGTKYQGDKEFTPAAAERQKRRVQESAFRDIIANKPAQISEIISSEDKTFRNLLFKVRSEAVDKDTTLQPYEAMQKKLDIFTHLQEQALAAKSITDSWLPRSLREQRRKLYKDFVAKQGVDNVKDLAENDPYLQKMLKEMKSGAVTNVEPEVEVNEEEMTTAPEAPVVEAPVEVAFKAPEEITEVPTTDEVPSQQSEALTAEQEERITNIKGLVTEKATEWGAESNTLLRNPNLGAVKASIGEAMGVEIKAEEMIVAPEPEEEVKVEEVAPGESAVSSPVVEEKVEEPQEEPSAPVTEVSSVSEMPSAPQVVSAPETTVTATLSDLPSAVPVDATTSTETEKIEEPAPYMPTPPASTAPTLGTVIPGGPSDMMSSPSTSGAPVEHQEQKESETFVPEQSVSTSSEVPEAPKPEDAPAEKKKPGLLGRLFGRG